jgi:ribose transport system ATP-binding protein
MKDAVLQVHGLTKRFAGVTVVDHVTFSVAPGESVGFVGQNGSGKSTLLKMLARYYRPDEGSFAIHEGADGESAEPHRHRGVRIAFVHQDLGLVPALTVTENLALGRGYPQRGGWLIDWRRAEEDARAIIREQGIRAKPSTVVRDLSLADRALLAIGRAVGAVGSARRPLLILDEPTSSLPDKEVGKVLEAIVNITRGGGSVVFVSHRLDEVLGVASRVLVIRDGRLVADAARSELTRDRLVALMLGRELERIVPRPATAVAAGTPRLAVERLSGHRLQDFTCSVGGGEIVGVTGLLGSGKGELGRILAGAMTASSGRVAIDGKAMSIRSPRDSVRAGIGYVPPDRRAQGGIMTMSATENLTLPDTRSFLRPFTRLLDHGAEALATLEWMNRAHVVPLAPFQRFDSFSGGNQQKLVYGRWIRLSPKVLVLDEPTQGVDVGAVADLYEIIRGQAAKGAAVLLMSSEWEHLPRVCHRVIVLDRGRAVAELKGQELTFDNIAAVAYRHFADGHDLPGHGAPR